MIAVDELDVERRIGELAESIYSLHAFDRMLVLGEELELSGAWIPNLCRTVSMLVCMQEDVGALTWLAGSRGTARPDL